MSGLVKFCKENKIEYLPCFARLDKQAEIKFTGYLRRLINQKKHDFLAKLCSAEVIETLVPLWCQFNVFSNEKIVRACVFNIEKKAFFPEFFRVMDEYLTYSAGSGFMHRLPDIYVAAIHGMKNKEDLDGVVAIIEWFKSIEFKAKFPQERDVSHYLSGVLAGDANKSLSRLQVIYHAFHENQDKGCELGGFFQHLFDLVSSAEIDLKFELIKQCGFSFSETDKPFSDFYLPLLKLPFDQLKMVVNIGNDYDVKIDACDYNDFFPSIRQGFRDIQSIESGFRFLSDQGVDLYARSDRKAYLDIFSEKINYQSYFLVVQEFGIELDNMDFSVYLPLMSGFKGVDFLVQHKDLLIDDGCYVKDKVKQIIEKGDSSYLSLFYQLMVGLVEKSQVTCLGKYGKLFDFLNDDVSVCRDKSSALYALNKLKIAPEGFSLIYDELLAISGKNWHRLLSCLVGCWYIFSQTDKDYLSGVNVVKKVFLALFQMFKDNEQKSLVIAKGMYEAADEYCDSWGYLSVKAICHEIKGDNKRVECSAGSSNFLHRAYESGPEIMSYATVVLLEVGHYLATEEINKFDISYDRFSGYTLTFDEKVVYLTPLLAQANFSHLVFSDKMVSLLYKNLIKFYDINKIKISFELTKAVSNIIGPELGRVVRLYFSDEVYVDLNRFTRGQCPEQGAESDNFIKYLLFSLLLNHAINILPARTLQSAEMSSLLRFVEDEPRNLDGLSYGEIYNHYCGYCKNKGMQPLMVKPMIPYALPKSNKFFRFETVSGNYLSAKLNNPQLLTSATSYSTDRSAVSSFVYKSNFTTVIKGVPGIVLQNGECEVLLPAGCAVVAHSRARDYEYNGYSGSTTGKHSLDARLVRSPSVLRQRSYLGEMALIVAYKCHLSKQYKIRRERHESIERPNHGLAHTYRVMRLIPWVTHLLADYARDENMRLFCAVNKGGMALDLLQVAAAFSVTGRESEVGFDPGNPDSPASKEYLAARRASAENLTVMLKEYSSERYFAFGSHLAGVDAPVEYASYTESFTWEQICRHLYHVVWQMGNPGFGETLSKAGFDEQEHPMMGYLHRILDIAHKLDLARVYGVQQYQSRLEECQSYLVRGDESKTAWLDLVRYAIELIKTHGNALTTNLSDANQLRPADSGFGYKSSFIGCSSSMWDVVLASNAVPEPGFGYLTKQKSAPVPASTLSILQATAGGGDKSCQSDDEAGLLRRTLLGGDEIYQSDDEVGDPLRRTLRGGGG